MKNNYEIVSLGENCLPRLYCTRNCLKKTKKMGELSLPFDLAGHKLESIMHFLKADFQDYFDNLKYLEKDDISCWFNIKYESQYNHDKDCGVNDYDKLVERFKGRIENFRKIMKDEKFIFFVLASYDDNSDDVNKLYEIIKDIRGDKLFKFIVADFTMSLDDKINKEIAVYKSKYHFSELKDWDAWDNKSTKTKQVEESLITFVKAEISNFFKVEVFKPKKNNYESTSMYLFRKFIRNIFSVTNESEKYKVIHILGLKFKIKKYLKLAQLKKTNKGH